MNNFRDCPFCNFNLNNSLAPLYRTYFQNILYYYVKCKKCKIVYLDPVPKHTTLVEIYSADKYHDKCYSVDKYKLYQISFNKTLMNISKYLKKKDNFLDYGCGSGFFLKFLNQQGYNVEGVEFDEDACKSARNNSRSNIQTVKNFLNSKKTYDFIYLGDVFEHLGNPKNDMMCLLSKLNPEGYICIDGPVERNPSLTNFIVLFNSFLKNKFKNTSLITQPPYHLSFFSKNSIYNFLLKFKELEFVESYTYETGWPLLGSNFLKNVLGSVSIFISKLPFFTKDYGNRNRIVFRKR